MLFPIKDLLHQYNLIFIFFLIQNLLNPFISLPILINFLYAFILNHQTKAEPHYFSKLNLTELQ